MSKYTYDQLIAMVHTPRRQVEDCDELSTNENAYVAGITDAWKEVVHDLVVADARSGDKNTWAELRPVYEAVLHCEKCTAMALSASVGVIAESAYRIDPSLKRQDFVARYREIMQPCK